MDFRILGPLEVRDEPGTVTLGGARPRAVLAMLLLNANQPVSADRLATALWGEDQPSGAAKNVHVNISRLRKALGGEDLLTTTPAGYCLHVQPDELDADRFARKVEEGDPHWPPAGRSGPGRSCAKRSRCGAGPRWPTWPTNRSFRRRSGGSRNSG